MLITNAVYLLHIVHKERENDLITTFGTTYKRLREAKNITMQKAADHIVSKSFLSRFERNLTNISFAKLYALLLNINVSVAEFIFIDNIYHHRHQAFYFDDTKDYLDQITKLTHQQLINDYFKKWQQNQSTYNYFNYLKQKHLTRTEHLTPTEIHEISNFLFNIETWTHYEIRLYMSTMDVFPAPTVYALTKQLLHNGEITLNVDWNHQADFTYILLKSALLACYQHDLENAVYFSNQVVKTIDNEQYLYEKTELHFIHGLIYLQKKETALGNQTINEVFSIFKQLDSPNLLRLYQQRLKKFQTWQS